MSWFSSGSSLVRFFPRAPWSRGLSWSSFNLTLRYFTLSVFFTIILKLCFWLVLFPTQFEMFLSIGLPHDHLETSSRSVLVIWTNDPSWFWARLLHSHLEVVVSVGLPPNSVQSTSPGLSSSRSPSSCFPGRSSSQFSLKNFFQFVFFTITLKLSWSESVHEQMGGRQLRSGYGAQGSQQNLGEASVQGRWLNDECWS